MARLFVALHLPDSTRQTVGALRSEMEGARWTPEAQLHITLSFLGEVSEHLIPDLQTGLSSIRAGRVTLSPERLDVFSSLRNPRVLVLRFRENKVLEQLQKDVTSIVASKGIKVESRRFTSHVTLARLRGVSPDDLRSYLQEEHILPGIIQPEQFILYRSFLGPKGARHQPLASFPLPATTVDRHR